MKTFFKHRRGMLALALVLLAGAAALFGTSLALRSRTSEVSIGAQRTLPGDAAFLGDRLLVGTASTAGENRIYALDRQGAELWSLSADSYVRRILPFGDVAACVLENKKVLFVDALGRVRSESAFLYPVTDLAYDPARRILAAAGSVSRASSAIFVIENFDVDTNYENVYTYFVRSPVFPIGVAISGGDVYYAGSNSKVYRCSESGGRAVLESRFTQSAFFADEGKFVLGYVNGTIDVYGSDFRLETSFSLGQKEVRLGHQPNPEGLFCAIENGGALGFYSLRTLSRTAAGRGVTLPERFGMSADGTAVMLKDGKLRFADESLADLSRIFGILFVPSIVLLVLSLAFTAYAVLRAIPRTGAAAQAAVTGLGRDLWRDRKCYLMLLPAFLFLCMFVFYPIVQGVLIAFQNYVPGVKAEWVGFGNFSAVFRNEYFWGSMKNMLIFLATDLFKAIVPPLIIAECIIALASRRSQYAARVMMYIPGILPGLAGLLIWKTGILGADGVVSQIFGALGSERFANFHWLGNDATAIWALVFIGFPYVGGYIILYGALMSVPGEFYDAAKLDGFCWFKRILYIDIPLIRPQLKYIFVLNFIGSIQDFQRVYMTTGGAFGTNIPALELFYNINTFNNYGGAAAMGVILFVIIFVASLFNLRMKSTE